MQAQLHALSEVKTFLDQHQLKHFIIGGIANAIWGRPRATLDADFKLLLGDFSLEQLVQLVGTKFKFRVTEPLSFAEQTLVMPIYASNKIPVDLIVGLLPYEEQVTRYAQMVEYNGVTFTVCRAEDLIVQKAISERQKDWDDIEGVLARQNKQLDQVYILAWLQQFAEILDKPLLLERYV